MDIAASLASRVTRESQAIRDSLEKAVIRGLKEFLDTQEFQVTLAKAVTLVSQDTQELKVKAGIRVTLVNPVTLDSQGTRVFLEFPVIAERADIAGYLASLDSLE